MPATWLGQKGASALRSAFFWDMLHVSFEVGGMTSCETLCDELHLSKYLMWHSLYRLTFRARYKLQSNPQKPAHSLQLLVWATPQWYTHLGTNTIYQSELTDDKKNFKTFCFQRSVTKRHCHVFLRSGTIFIVWQHNTTRYIRAKKVPSSRKVTRRDPVSATFL